MESRMETYLNAAISGDTENLPNPISRIDFLLCELIKTLGESGASIEEVEKIVTDKVAEIVADAPKDFDTLKELSDWIYTHEESAAAMNTAIQTNTNSIESLMTDVNKKANSDDVYDKVTADSRFLGIDATADKAVADENGSNISETFSAVKNDITLNRTTLGTQCKNLLKNTAVTQTISGATVTVNSDKTVSVHGTTTSQPTLIAITKAMTLKAHKKYCLTGAYSSSIQLSLRDTSMSRVFAEDNGNGVEYTPNKDIEAIVLIRIGIISLDSPVTLYPMLRYADITDSTYEPYKENVNERLTENKSNIAINKTTLGYRCKNLLKNTASTTTVNNVTFTVNSDGSITAKQTTTASGNATIKVATMTLKPGTYILTGDDEIRLSGFGAIRFYVGSTIYSSNKPHTFDTEVTIDVRLFVWSGVNINGSKTIYPMLRYADILDDTYEPYKESIDERITNNVSDIAINKSTLGYQRKNIFDETEYLSSIASVSIGTFNISGNSITLTATGKDCYTKPHTNSDGGYRIPVEPNTDYILSWESDNTYAGLVYVFLNGNISQQRLANNKDTKYIKFTTKSDTTFITFRLGVATSGNSITYSNIMLRYADITDDIYKPYQPSLQEQIEALEARIAALEV